MCSFSVYSQSNLVSDIIVMSDVKVSVEVIKAYINNQDFVLGITPSNIIQLTKHGVTNEVIQLLVEKNIESKKILQEMVRKREYRESYDYFYNKYLLPRQRKFK